MPAVPTDHSAVQAATSGLPNIVEVPGPFLSMGEAVAAIGLLLAFYQLMTPGMRFRLRFHRNGRSTAIFFGVSAIVLSIVAAWLRVGLFGPAWLPVLVETLGAAAILTAASLLAVGHWGKMSFTPANAERFAAEVRGAVVRGDPIELASVMEDLEPALGSVFDAAARFDARDVGRYVNPDILDSKERQTYHAVELMAALGDVSLCRVLVTRSPSHAKNIMELCTQHREAPSVADLVRQIMRQAMLRSDSILHREMSGQGVGRFVRLVDIALRDAGFIESRARPLACLQSSDASPLAAKAMGHALTVASSAYLRQGADVGPTQALGIGFESLRGMVMWPLWRAAQASENEFPHSPAFEMSQAYADAAMELCEGLTSRPLPADIPAFDQDDYNAADDRSLWGRAVEGVIGVLRLASHPGMSADDIRAVASSVWFRVERNPAPTYESVLSQLQGRIRCAFLKPEHPLMGPLPMCSAALVVLVGLVDRPRTPAHILTPKELRAHLLGELSAAPEPGQALRLLPRGYRYNPDNKSIIIEAAQHGRPGREIALEEVPDA